MGIKRRLDRSIGAFHSQAQFWDDAISDLWKLSREDFLTSEEKDLSALNDDQLQQQEKSIWRSLNSTLDDPRVTHREWHLALVRQGLRWESSSFLPEGLSNDSNECTMVASRVTRVPGCLATVYIQTVMHIPNHSEAPPRVLSLRGTADAHIPRGLLAGIAAFVPQHEVENLLQPWDNTRRLPFLSTGRNDGLGNMIRTMQGQIQECLQLKIGDRNVTSSSSHKDDDANAVDTVKISPVRRSVKPRVALLLSGGVDSSVALHRLVQDGGYEVTAFYLKIWLEDKMSELYECPWEEDYQYCQAVCQQLNVPLETMNLQEEYRQQILAYTLEEARQGRTPNPDILCNRRIKFGCFWDAIADQGFDHVATGHYAQVQRRPDATVQLHRAPDPVKDQSYFLAALTQAQLQRVLFPIGDWTKSQVRSYAEEHVLANRFRPDSQGLCFLGRVKFSDFLQSYLSDMPGPIVDACSGAILGQHRGLWYHTTGQRKGLGPVLMPTATSRGPWYVVGKDRRQNILYCTNQYENAVFASTRSRIPVEGVHWIAGRPPDRNGTDASSLHLAMKLRHGPNMMLGELTLTDNTSGWVQLPEKDHGLAAGQFVVFYDPNGTECYGCAVMSEHSWDLGAVNATEIGMAMIDDR